MRQSVHFGNLSMNQKNVADKLGEVLNGETYMDLEVIAAPCGGSLMLSVEGEADSMQDVLEMALYVTARALAKS